MYSVSKKDKVVNTKKAKMTKIVIFFQSITKIAKKSRNLQVMTKIATKKIIFSIDKLAFDKV